MSVLTCVLGHERVLEERGGDARHRVTARAGRRVVGVAALEPLYGSGAEAAVAVEDPTDAELIHHLLDELRGLAHRAKVEALRFVLSPDQLPTARSVPGAEVLDDALLVRVPSGETTDAAEGTLPMRSGPGQASIGAWPS